MVSYCCVGLLFNVAKRPSIVLHLSHSICANNSRNCRPFLPSQLFYLMIAICSACGILYDSKIVFTSSLKFMSSLYLCSASQLNVGCFIMGPPSLDTTFCVLSATATVMVCTAAIVASATACVIASLVFVCCLAIIHICTLSAYVCLYDFYS